MGLAISAFLVRGWVIQLFTPVYDGAQQLTIVLPDRCYILISLAGYAVHLPGDFAECGVYKGNGAYAGANPKGQS